MSNSFVTPRTVAHQAPLSIGFHRQESWNGLPFPSPSDLPNPGIKPTSPTLAGTLFTPEPPGKPSVKWGSDFIILHIFNQLSQHHLLNPLRVCGSLGMIKMLLLQWQSCFCVGQKVHSDFSIRLYGKTQRNFSGQTNIIQHINISKQQGVHLKCIQCYISIYISI